MSGVGWVVWDWIVWDEWCEMSCVRWVVWDEWCEMNGVRWVVWDEWCELSCVRWVVWDELCELVVWGEGCEDERCRMSGVRWVVWDEGCEMSGVNERCGLAWGTLESRRWRWVERLSLLPHGCRRGARLRSHLLPSWMASCSVYAIHWPVWAAASCHQFFSRYSYSRFESSMLSASHIQRGHQLLRWLHHHW